MEANRRNFLGMMVGGVLGAAAVRAWPFRVYSFPSRIVMSEDCFLLNGGLVRVRLTEAVGLINGFVAERMSIEFDRIVLAA